MASLTPEPRSFGVFLPEGPSPRVFRCSHAKFKMGTGSQWRLFSL